MKAPAFRLELQSPNGTPLQIITLDAHPPYSEEEIERLGESLAEIIEDRVGDYYEYHRKMKSLCDCGYYERREDGPVHALFMHSSECKAAL